MSTTIDVICYKSKVLKNNENPLMLRVTKDRKRRYLSIGISVNSQYWDFDKNRPKRNCPNKEYISKIISDKIQAYRDQIMELKSDKKEFTAKTLIEKVHQPTKRKTVQEVFDDQIERLFAEKRRGYALSNQHVLSSLLAFNKHLDIYFSDIDIAWLQRYETWLRSNDIAVNTIGIRFRTLRAVFNVAIRENIVKEEYYPFKDYKVSKLRQETVKRSITKEEIISVITYPCDAKRIYERLSVDLFTFSYLMAGINFVDIAYLTRDSIVDNRLIYFRRKTHKLIKIPLQPEALELINKYSDSENPYLFPILNNFHKTEIQRANRVHKVISKVNKQLKEIGKDLNLPIDLTTYLARHTFATQICLSNDVPMETVSKMLGHSSIKTTQNYDIEFPGLYCSCIRVLNSD